MNIYINNEEKNAIFDAWESVNEKLEGCENEEAAKELAIILSGLKSIIQKIKKAKA